MCRGLLLWFITAAYFSLLSQLKRTLIRSSVISLRLGDSLSLRRFRLELFKMDEEDFQTYDLGDPAFVRWDVRWVCVQQNKRLSSANFPKFPFNFEKPYNAAVEPTSPLFKIPPDPKLTWSNSYFARCPQYQGDLFPLPRPRETHLTFSPRAASLCPPVPPLASRDEGISAAFIRLTRRQLAN